MGELTSDRSSSHQSLLLQNLPEESTRRKGDKNLRLSSRIKSPRPLTSPQTGSDQDPTEDPARMRCLQLHRTRQQFRTHGCRLTAPARATIPRLFKSWDRSVQISEHHVLYIQQSMVPSEAPIGPTGPMAYLFCLTIWRPSLRLFLCLRCRGCRRLQHRFHWQGCH